MTSYRGLRAPSRLSWVAGCFATGSTLALSGALALAYEATSEKLQRSPQSIAPIIAWSAQERGFVANNPGRRNAEGNKRLLTGVEGLEERAC